MKLKQLWYQLDAAQRGEFCGLAGTKQTYLLQLLGGHRCPSLRVLTGMVAASKLMFPDDPKKWLTVGRTIDELQVAQVRRAQRRAAV